MAARPALSVAFVSPAEATNFCRLDTVQALQIIEREAQRLMRDFGQV